MNKQNKRLRQEAAFGAATRCYKLKNPRQIRSVIDAPFRHESAPDSSFITFRKPLVRSRCFAGNAHEARQLSRPVRRVATSAPLRRITKNPAGSKFRSFKSVSSVAVLVPAHNEVRSIRSTVEALLAQDRTPELVVVICDNCNDGTETALADMYHPSLRVISTSDNTHRKAGALNWAYSKFCRKADLIITVDADTILPPNAVGDWVREFESDERLGGSCAKFTLRGKGILTRLQRNEYARGVDLVLQRGYTTVLGGAAAAMRKKALDQIAGLNDGRLGPWTHESQVEDLELTYRIRTLGYRCQISKTVRAYTDAMKTIRALWGQRMKWQIGTAAELMNFGFNRLTLPDWSQQAQGFLLVLVRSMWLYLMIFALFADQLNFNFWLCVTPPLIFAASEFKQAFRIPHRDKHDLLLAITIVPIELFAMLRAAWFLAGWWKAVVARITGREQDRWQLQYLAEQGGDKNDIIIG